MDLDSWLPMMRSPGGARTLRRNGEGLVDEADGRYPVEDGIPRLVGPEALHGDDASWNRFYDVFAPFYDLNERVWGRVLSGTDVGAERRRIVESLGIDAGSTLLEVCTGPGVYQPWLAQAIGPNGRLAAVDLSWSMLRRCAQRTRDQVPVPLIVQANGAALPFADASFDALFHFGGIKLFTSPERALQECARVLRRGGRLFLGDEGFAPTVPATDWRRRVLPRINPGFLRELPRMPAGLEIRKQEWVYGGFGFLWTLERAAPDSE